MLCRLATVANALHEFASAARLAGAAEATWAPLATPLDEAERADLARVVASASAALGASTFAAVREAGRRLTVEEAIVEATALVQSIAGGDGALGTKTSSTVDLTARQREVLRLIVDGRSDKEIAAALSISYRTATNHVTNLLAKLGVGSRTAAATKAMREGLV